MESDQAISFRDTKGLNLVKVEPLNAILDPQYFVRAVNECEMAVLSRREQLNHLKQTLIENEFEMLSMLRGLSLDSELNLLQNNQNKQQQQFSKQNALRKGTSQVARVSLKARQRWIWVCQKVRVLVRVRSILYDI
eukprot:TRINITY_DN16640_c0_g1_i5.p3 TRINITY_DN16640_c0_g1~~TRINITY_DN16640_c0_g1_i5.p3  ORF type:complete len:136 (+),score=17.42 TRINITY_DN16640_c0_g1_i5:379-786(+)